MTADKEYVQWLHEVKLRYRQSHVKAAVRVNTAMLEFYWSIGRDLVALKAEQRWGAGVVKQFSMDMRKAFPNETGLSLTNVKYMKRWYLFYHEGLAKSQRPVDLLGNEKSQRPVGLLEESQKEMPLKGLSEIRQRPVDEIVHQAGEEIRHQAGDEFEMPPQFGIVPWKHHVYIFTKSQSLEEALFYINKVASEGWSRLYLEQQVDEHNKPLGVATYQLQEVLDRTVAELELKKKQKEEEQE